MTITAVLRSAAIATALVGLVDPSWTIRRSAPVAVELISPVTAAGDEVRHRLARSLGDAVTFDSEAEPTALVVVGSTTALARGHSTGTLNRDTQPGQSR